MRLSSHPSQPIHFISNIFVPLHRGFQQHPSLLWQRALLSSGLEANSLGAPDKLSNLSATLTTFNFQTPLASAFCGNPSSASPQTQTHYSPLTPPGHGHKSPRPKVSALCSAPPCSTTWPCEWRLHLSGGNASATSRQWLTGYHFNTHEVRAWPFLCTRRLLTVGKNCYQPDFEALVVCHKWHHSGLE